MPREVVLALAVLVVAVFATDLVILLEPAERARADYAAAWRAPSATRAGDATRAHNVAPPVAPLTELRRPHLFVHADHPFSAAMVAKVRGRKGVTGVEVTGAADVLMDGKRIPTMGVDPSTFRSYTPSPVAGSDVLWRDIASGDMAVSFELGNDGGLTLGSAVVSGSRTLRVAAYATVGMSSIAAVVSRETARELRVPEGNALVVSAPGVDSGRLRTSLLRMLPKGSQVVAINPVSVASRGRTALPPHAFMSGVQVETALLAAASKIGRPYVWGAEGPNTFDCSGLVQWAYGQAGVRLPRVTDQQWASGRQVPLSEARPGDLLFWRNDPTNPGYISHVAIYWGGTTMLHAPRTGDVVKISTINTRNLAGVVRISPSTFRRGR